MSGDTTAAFIASHTNRVLASQWCTHVVDQYGVNDLTGGTVQATIAANRSTIAGYFTGKPVFGTTIPPVTTSTDSWVTQVNQALNFYNSNRYNFNALVAAGISGETNYFDISSALDPTNSGKWPVTGQSSYYTGDGTHEGNTANIAIARSGVINVSWFKR